MHNLATTLFALVAVGLAASHAYDDMDTALIEAQTTVQDMQDKGANQEDCMALANTMCKEQQTLADNAKKKLAQTKTGASCTKKGQDLVKKANGYLGKIQAAIKAALGDVEKLRKTQIKFSVPFDKLKKNKRGFLEVKSAQWDTTNEKIQKYLSKKTSANAKLSAATKAAKDAAADAQKRVNKCLCKVRASRDKSWADAQKQDSMTRKAAMKCAAMKCVLSGKTSVKSCTSNIPKLNKPKLNKAAEALVMQKQCPVNCQLSSWGSWSEWGSCSKKCGQGTHSRNRTRKVTVKALNGGRLCDTKRNEAEKQLCIVKPCPVNCQLDSWGSWSRWGSCSKKCDKGQQSRKRTRGVKVEGQNGGLKCDKNSQTEQSKKDCYIKACVDLNEQREKKKVLARVAARQEFDARYIRCKRKCMDAWTPTFYRSNQCTGYSSYGYTCVRNGKQCAGCDVRGTPQTCSNIHSGFNTVVDKRTGKCEKKNYPRL